MKKYPTIRYFTFLWMLFLCASCNAGTKESLPDPIAAFSYTVDADNARKVNFKNESKHTMAYAWDFGDNKGSSTNENPSH